MVLWREAWVGCDGGCVVEWLHEFRYSWAAKATFDLLFFGGPAIEDIDPLQLRRGPSLDPSQSAASITSVSRSIKKGCSFLSTAPGQGQLKGLRWECLRCRSRGDRRVQKPWTR